MLNNKGLKLLLSLLLGLSVVLVSGCQGCRDDKEKTTEEKKKEEEEKKEREKPNFETEAAVVYPGRFTNEMKTNRTKRGHWVSVDYRLQANKFDTQGDLVAHSYAGISPVTVENTDYFAVSSRPFSVAKGEQKNLATNIYLPRRDKGSSANIMFNMKRNSSNVSQLSEIHGIQLMRPYQYHMVVLTNRADVYSYVNLMDSVRIELPETGRVLNFYTVIRTKPEEEPIPLPRQSLFWTTIAYIIWDNLEVDQLDAEQQQALVDWIHHGGQLILSGPDCLEKLANSFLAEFLPAKIKSSRNFSSGDFADINAHWAVKDQNQDLKRKLVVNDQSPVIGVDFEPHPKARYVENTGKIAIERAVGRGRIVATAFSMDDRPIIRWPSYRSFFNGALLRKPARKFGLTNDRSLAFSWIDDSASIFDPLLGSTLRYLSRDLVYSDGGQAIKGGTPKDGQISTRMISGLVFGNDNYLGAYSGQLDNERFRTTDANQAEVRNLRDHWHYGGYNHDKESGTAGWNDESGISIASRETLRKAAGISPPSSEFVLKMLSIYLLVLVPINWLVFRAIGRVEWAWIAAPFIAIVGALMVAKMASLDIGFVRSNSQVACLEIFADYPRAHVSQYSALYTSLSTGYELELDNPSAVSLPLGDPDRKWEETTMTPVTIRQTIKNQLEGFQVQSNSTGMLHTEMMVDMQGTFSLIKESGAMQVSNNTPIEISEAAVLRRLQDDSLEAAWIGELDGGSMTDELQFQSIDEVTDPWSESEVLTARINAIEYWQRLKKYHEFAADGVATLNVKNIKDNIPELAEKWPEFMRLVQQYSENSNEILEDRKLSYSIFSNIIKRIDRVSSISVSALFRQVSRNLELAPGEIRLIAVTNDNIGNNAFQPASTQTQQQTLVVVHLQRPPFAPAKPDVNTTEDFTGNSDLDWLDQLSGLDELEDLSEELDEEEQ